MAKQIKVREDNYFAVQGWMVTELKLKGNALMLYAIIYGFSQTTNTAFTGSVDYLCEWLGGVSRPTVINTLDNLVKQNATRVLSLSVIDGTLKISVKKNRYGINNKEVLMIWEVNTGYLKPLLSENPEESTEDKKDDKPDGEQDKGGEKDYGF